VKVAPLEAKKPSSPERRADVGVDTGEELARIEHMNCDERKSLGMDRGMVHRM